MPDQHFYKELAYQLNMIKDDLAECRKAKFELEKTAETYMALFDAANDAIFIHDARDGHVLTVNQRAVDCFGHTRDEILQLGISAISGATSPYDQATFLKKIRRAAKGEDLLFQWQTRKNNGDFFWLEIALKTVEFHGRKRIVTIARDITSRKTQEAALLAKEIEYKTILQTAEDGFLLTDSNGRILETNPAYRKMSGYNEQELLSITLAELEGLMTPDEIVSEVELVKKRGHDRFDTRHRKKDGSLYDVEVSVKHLPNSGGKFVNFVRDISVLKRAEKEKSELETQLNLSQKLESVGRLAGGVAHDLNNLLTPILGYCEVLMEEISSNAPHQKKLNAIYQAGQGARSLIGQLLAFSRKQTLDFSLIDVDKVITAFKKLLRRTIREDIRIEINASPGAKTIMADRNQLEQIIMNLAVNAADAMPSGGTLTINTDMARLDETYASKRPGVQPGEYILMSFVDTGHGMDQDTCNKIFEPFYSTKGTQGTGLGLSTVYGIVKQHRGNIWVYSELGKGSVFKVYLPYVSGSDSESVESVSPKEHIRDISGSEIILLAEDNDDVRDLTAEILMDSGYTVFKAGNGNAALETWAASDESFQLLVTDVIMPEMNGKELFDVLNSLDGNLKVLYMSGYPDNAIARHGVIDENTPFIQKPFNKNDFLVKVRQVLDDKF